MSITVEHKYSVPECIGLTVNQYLFDAKIQKNELARVLGVAKTNVSRRIRGLADWSAEDLMLTAELLGIEVSDLLPARNSDGDWTPAAFIPGKAKAPASLETGADQSHLRESNSRPIHYE